MALLGMDLANHDRIRFRILSRLLKLFRCWTPGCASIYYARLKWIVAVFIFSFGVEIVLAQASSPNPEYKLKAVYLFNFVRYVDWPETAFVNDESPLIIGVLGDDPFGKFLDETVAGEVLGNRKMEVRRYRHVSEIDDCHLLYVSRSEAVRQKSILARLKGRSILFVSDMENFLENGGAIQFFTEKNKIRFRINVESVKDARLSISSKLLQLSGVTSKGER